MLDIGANKGIIGLEFEEQFDHVVFIEPNREALEILRENIKDNHTLIEKAASNVIGTTTFLCPVKSNEWGSIDKGRFDMFKRDKMVTTSYEVETITIDSLNLKNISFIKIDTEGHENVVIEGMLETIENNNHPPIFLENKRKEADLGIRMLLENGYKEVAKISSGNFLVY